MSFCASSKREGRFIEKEFLFGQRVWDTSRRLILCLPKKLRNLLRRFVRWEEGFPCLYFLHLRYSLVVRFKWKWIGVPSEARKIALDSYKHSIGHPSIFYVFFWTCCKPPRDKTVFRSRVIFVIEEVRTYSICTAITIGPTCCCHWSHFSFLLF